MVKSIARSKYIFVENNNIEILFSNYIFEYVVSKAWIYIQVYIVRK